MQGCSEPIASQLNRQSSFLIFLGGKLRNLAPLGAHGFFVAWPQKLIVFSCVSMPVLSSILAAAAKSPLRDKGSQKSPAGGGGQSFGLVQFRPKFSSGMEAAPATHRLCLHCMRKESGLLGRWHGSSPPAVTLLWPQHGQQCKEVQPMGDPWEIWSRRCPHSGRPCGLRRPACSCSTA